MNQRMPLQNMVRRSHFGHAHLLANRNNRSIEGSDRKEMNMCQAITNAIDVQMMRDESTIVFGEDVKFGGVFRCTVSHHSHHQRL